MTSNFDFNIDVDFCDWLVTSRDSDDLWRLDSDPDYGQSEYLACKDTIVPEVEKQLEYMTRRFKLAPSLSNPKVLHVENFPEDGIVHSIRSMVGDDEIITSNCIAYNMLCIATGPVLSRIKVSWEDVGFNRHLFNFTEGWVFLPPSADSSFESVTKYAQRSGVPIVLDPVKFKNLSAVRKQSDMENDFPSKFSSLSKAASWTNSAWPTWALHQFSLLLGIEIFDFIRSKVFPFLFQWEGGCGGSPPWNNLYTAAGAIFRYKNGRATRGILGIMRESDLLFRNEISPGEAFFTKNLHLAMSGDKRWADIRSRLEVIRKGALDLGIEEFPNVDQTVDEIIPAELMQKSAPVYPQDALSGVAVAYLREKGFISTELDVVLSIEEQKKLDAVWGETPMREIFDMKEMRMNEYREAYLEVISELSLMRVEPSVQAKLDEIGSPLDPDMLVVMERYYNTRVEQSSFFTSFMYNDRVRVFKTEDVKSYFDKGVVGIKNGFCESVDSYYRPERLRSFQLPDEERIYSGIESWLRSDSLQNLLNAPFPEGVGPDDSRIARDLDARISSAAESGYDGFLVLIISSDKRMINMCQRLLEHNLGKKGLVRVVGLSVLDYFRYSLTEPTYRNPRQKAKEVKWLQTMLYNPVSRDLRMPHGPLLTLLEREAQFFFRCKKITFDIEYDYPNINRAGNRYQFLESEGTLVEFSGGYLPRDLVRDRLGQFSRESIDDLFARDEFDFSRVKTHVAPRSLDGRDFRLYSAKRGMSLDHSLLFR